MYAIVKTGGKQYRAAVGDVLSVEKLDAQAGDTVQLTAIAIIDGDKVEANPEKAAKTAVVAKVLEQYRGEKQLVFKFKKRKNYKKMRGHRQSLTKIQIESIGKASAKKAEKKAEQAAEVAVPEQATEAE